MKIEVCKERNRLVDLHRGNKWDWLHRHEHVCAEAARCGPAAIRWIVTDLFQRVSDMNNLLVAWDHVVSRSGCTAGPDGLTKEDFAGGLELEYLRGLKTELSEGGYRAGCSKKYRRRKKDGGFRWIHIPDLADRVVQRAIVQVVQPLLEEIFDSRSFGYRKHRSRFDAFALAERLAADSRLVWLAEDLRAAFDNLPLQRVLQVFQKYVPNAQLTRLVRLAVDTGARRGILQGGPLSPLLLNIYCHHVLDRPWRAMVPEIPLLRFADDLLVICESVQQAEDARRRLRQLLQPAGLALKASKDGHATIHRLAKGESLGWLGLDINYFDDGLQFRITESAWDRVYSTLQLRAEFPSEEDLWECGPQKVVIDWLWQMGPAYRDERRDEVFKNIFRLGRLAGMNLCPYQEEFKHTWRKAYRQWVRTRKKAAEAATA